MPGFLLHFGADVSCSHAGKATPVAPNPRVKVSNQPIVGISSSYIIAGCSLPTPPAANGPCVTAQFVTSAVRITANGVPVLLIDSQSLCTPTGTPLLPIGTQPRVKGA